MTREAGRTLRVWFYFALIALLSLFPLLVLVEYSLAPGWRFPELIPARIDLRGLEYVWSQSGRLAAALGSSLFFSCLTAALTFALCIIPARHLARAEFRGKSLLEGLLLAPALVPPMTFSMGMHLAFIHLGLIDTTFGVVLVLSTFSYPYMLRALVAGYQSFGPEYELCARNLGADWWTVLWRVDLPLLIPAMV
ncbi:MAG: ABC transporter permease subunit, partial [Proteobacteria bacterium]|nr:ABC transporter permease subunit [Pseudomonadota bacterium]